MKKIFIHINLLVALLTSCNKEDAPDLFQSTGKVITEERDIEPFHTIELRDNINLYLQQDSAYWLKIKAGKNLLSDIITNNKDGILNLSNQNKYNWVRSFEKPINITIGLPDIKEILYKGSGNIQCNNLINATSFDFNCWEGAGEIHLHIKSEDCYFRVHTGTANLTVSGQSKNAYYYTTSYSPIHAEEMIAKNTSVLHRGINDCYVYAEEELNINIEKSGNVYYSGNPKTKNINLDGEGKLFKYNL